MMKKLLCLITLCAIFFCRTESYAQLTKADAQAFLSNVNLNTIKHFVIVKAYGLPKLSMNQSAMQASTVKFKYMDSALQITGNDTTGSRTQYTMLIPYANIRNIIYNKTWILQIHLSK